MKARVGDRAVVERLRGGLGGVAAALEQDDVESAGFERQRKGDAGGTCTGNAQIGLQAGSGRNVVGVENHRLRQLAACLQQLGKGQDGQPLRW